MAENQFQQVHRLAREVRIERHARGCPVCRTNPKMCLIRAQIEGVRKEDWLRMQKEGNESP